MLFAAINRAPLPAIVSVAEADIYSENKKEALLMGRNLDVFEKKTVPAALMRALSRLYSASL